MAKIGLSGFVNFFMGAKANPFSMHSCCQSCPFRDRNLRERERERQRQTDRQTDRQRQTETERDRQTDRVVLSKLLIIPA